MSKAKKTTKTKTLFYPLVPNDLIEIIAPGSSAPFENLAKGVEILRAWGFQVQYDERILKPEMYLANSDQYRFEAFRQAMLNPRVKAVWCLRGGYGAIRLLPKLEKMPVPKKAKLLIGFSDVTSLHNLINRKWKWPSLHAPLIDRLGMDKLSSENLAELQRSLMDADHVGVFDSLIALNTLAEKKKVIQAPMVGGNLTVLTSSVGTPSQLKTKGKILFLEEIGERGYRVDRYLQQLKQAQMFEGVQAVVCGDFINGQESDGKDLVSPTLENFFRDLKVPSFKGMQAGHGEIQRPVFFNTQTVLTCGSRAQMLNYSPR